jgi:hypothetical protein
VKSKLKAKSGANLPSTWTITTECTANGRIITPGTELSFKGVKGRFRFQRMVTHADGRVWLDVFGGPENHEMLRSFGVDRIKTVHRIAKKRSNHQ